MLYSRPCEYAIRTMAYLARVGPDKRAQAQEIAAAEGIPAPFPAKILRQLARSNLINSLKGPGGGFSLNRASQEISLYDIFRVVDGVKDLDRSMQRILSFTIGTYFTRPIRKMKPASFN